jgi:hypothetical protein
LTKDVEDVSPPPDDKTLVIEDGNVAFYYLKDLPPNFRDICARLFDMVVRKSDIIFSTYMYLENSTKSDSLWIYLSCSENRRKSQY